MKMSAMFKASAGAALVLAVGAAIALADGWGRKVGVTSTSTVTTISSTLPVKKLSIYNAGTCDVACLFNVTAAQLTTAITSSTPTAIYIPALASFEYTQEAGPGSAQLVTISSVALYADCGTTTNTVYISGY